MFGFGKVLVYRSKDKADWEKAQNILTEAGVKMKAWRSVEPPIGGLYGSVDIRSFGRNIKVPKDIYKIEVEKALELRAKSLLDGKVLPVRSYGPDL